MPNSVKIEAWAGLAKPIVGAGKYPPKDSKSALELEAAGGLSIAFYMALFIILLNVVLFPAATFQDPLTLALNIIVCTAAYIGATKAANGEHETAKYIAIAVMIYCGVAWIYTILSQASNPSIAGLYSLAQVVAVFGCILALWRLNKISAA